MDKREIARAAILAWMKMYNARNNDDYDFNPDKVDKMNEIIALCQELEQTYEGCHIVRVELTPKYIQGVIEMLVEGEWAIGQPPRTIECFQKIVALSDGVNIEPFGDDFFHISFFVEDLYLHIKKA